MIKDLDNQFRSVDCLKKTVHKTLESMYSTFK